jgi:hypothetical protein
MKRLDHKLLTKPIWWWETHQKYPIRQKAFDLSPIYVNPDPSSILVVLTTPNNICDAAWAAQSILKYLPTQMGLWIVVDGELSTVKVENIKVLFPGVTLIQTRTLLEELRPIAPNVVELGECNPVGRKLAITLYIQQKYNTILSDADILCFGEMPEVYQAIINCGSGLYIQEFAGLNADSKLLKRVQSLGYDYAPTLNSGFLYIPVQSFQIEMVEELLSAEEHDPTSWFVEQTIFAVLMQQAHAKPLARSRYVVSTQRQFYFEKDVDYDQIALRHFVTPVRHLMYSKGMPKLRQQLQQKKQHELLNFDDVRQVAHEN